MAEQSLIPKKTPHEERINSGGVFIVISAVFFIVSFVLSGGLYAYSKILQSSIAKQRIVLQNEESSFEQDTIAQHERTASSIAVARTLLARHMRQSPLFMILEKNVLPDVSFSSFSFAEGQRTITLLGEAGSYASVAFQARVFEEQVSEVAKATFAGLSLNDTLGTVNFQLAIALRDNASKVETTR